MAKGFRSHPAILGLFTLINLRGKGEIAQGELMRFFAEIALYQTALPPSQGVNWAAIDDHPAQATLQDGAISLTMIFEFNDQGQMAASLAKADGRTFRHNMAW